ncbi:hypothetical protein [Mogibacterium sp. CM50]|uniref:hypothetical protein n=1 Tax=Mogibacterium sp. CM50 TaxID=936375 RepID=UPI00027C4EEC|nr:hypothetical protein [Mogibacterium sp. CM50]EJU23293.1 hypothetical protein HMPREF1152_1051 [Mogibacterium sp. CM50]
MRTKMEDRTSKKPEYFIRLIKGSIPRLKTEIKYEPTSQYDEKTVGPFIKTYFEGVEKAYKKRSKTDISFLYVKKYPLTWLRTSSLMSNFPLIASSAAAMESATKQHS